jgi:D-alanine-D-alanine ligase
MISCHAVRRGSPLKPVRPGFAHTEFPLLPVLLKDRARGLIPDLQFDHAVRYRAVGCEGMGRLDFLLEHATQKLYINEINNIPGFTSISMYPKMWEASGIGFMALIDRLIDLALERHEQKKATKFSP